VANIQQVMAQLSLSDNGRRNESKVRLIGKTITLP